jgi:hypothetical protein
MLRWFERLHAPGKINEQRRDDFYAFFTTCFHLKDWLKNDPLVPKPVRKRAENLVNDKRSLGVCADIANGVKHLVRKKKKLVRFDPDARLSIESPSEIAITALGKSWSADMVAGRCVLLWQNFLHQEGLL